MKKMKLFLLSLVVVIGFMGGCSSENADNDQKNATNDQSETSGSSDSSTEKQEKIVTISITKNKGEEKISEKEIPIKDGAILFDVMKDNFKLQDKDGYITSIEGIEAKESEQMAWMFSVNDEMASVGAKDLKLSPGDSVNFDLQSWE